MAEAHLELRSPERLMLGYLIAPVIGALTAWLGMSIAPLDGAWLRSLFLLPWVMLFGVPLIAIAELLFVVPLVWGFQRYRWRWLNGWSACLAALLVGASLGFVLGSVPAAPNVQPLLADRLALAAVVALPAVAVALTIRLVAYRTPAP